MNINWFLGEDKEVLMWVGVCMYQQDTLTLRVMCRQCTGFHPLSFLCHSLCVVMCALVTQTPIVVVGLN